MRNDIVPLVSFILPVFNGGILLHRAVASVLMQTFEKWELIIIDDGSSDNSIKGLPQDARIRVFMDGRNLGISARLNQAVAIAEGKYIARMDHDDICHPTRISRQLEFMEKFQDVDLVSVKSITIDERGNLLGMLPFAESHDDICARPWRGFPMPHPSWLGRIEWFRANPYAEPAPYACEDSELLMRTYKTSKFHSLPETLLAYQIRTCTPFKKLLKTRLALFGQQIDYFSREKMYLFACLSAVVTVLRIMKDLANLACPNVNFVQPNRLSATEEVRWKVLLDGIQSDASTGL